jgi:RNase P subunit RPR2
MALVGSGQSSVEMTWRRPLCPRCKAPMWTVRVQAKKAAEDNHILQCPRCEHSQIAFHQKQKLMQGR